MVVLRLLLEVVVPWVVVSVLNWRRQDVVMVLLLCNRCELCVEWWAVVAKVVVGGVWWRLREGLLWGLLRGADCFGVVRWGLWWWWWGWEVRCI